MKHAGGPALDALEPLLARLRDMGRLQERRRGVFYLNSRPFLHFHEDPSGLYADIRDPDKRDFERLRADGDADRVAVVARVAATLSAAPIKRKNIQR